MTKNIGLVIQILCRGIVFPGREQRREKLFVSAVLKEDRLLIFSDWKKLTFGGLSERWYTEDRFTIVPSGS
jgi:streptomycin 6-kinase